MKAAIKRYRADSEFYTRERCHIIELSNTSDDPALSIARVRVEPGVTTEWHRLLSPDERYVVLEGLGLMEVEGLDPTELGPGDVVLIPAGCAQRIRNTGDRDLVFLALCSPPFGEADYQVAE